MGISLDALLFAKHKLQLLLETSTDKFFGDKLFTVDDQGRQNKTVTIYTIKAGRNFSSPKTLPSQQLLVRPGTLLELLTFLMTMVLSLL